MEIPETDVDDLAQRLDAGEVALLDVRRPDEWSEAHVVGATLVPLDELPDRLEEVPSDRPLMVICRSGARSGVATEALRRAGVDATNVAGGMLAWIDSGRPVAHGEE